MTLQTPKTILVVAAHPDDEVLGCAATVAKYVMQGATAHLVIMTPGVGGRVAADLQHNKEILTAQAKLSLEAKEAADLIGYETITILEHPDNRLDTVSKMDISLQIKEIVQKVKPEIVFTHHPGDYNWDHTITFESTMMASRPNPPEFSPSEIRTFEVLSSTERAWQDSSRAFHPNLYVDISDFINLKTKAMTIYSTENRPYPHPRSEEAILNLALRRGNEVGMVHAEAFHLVRKIES
jgi:LmbE family N-acetylglucosaminyl deacetylase